MIHITLRKWLIIVMLFALAGCGFHPRGENFIPLKLRLLHLTSGNPYGDFETRLRKSLQINGVHLVAAPEEAPLTLKVLSTNQISYPLTIGTSNQATVYSFTYVATLVLMDAKGKILAGPRTFRSGSTLIVNANQVIGTNNQIPLLAQQLQMDIINQLFNWLGSEEVAYIVAKAPKNFKVVQ